MNPLMVTILPGNWLQVEEQGFGNSCLDVSPFRTGTFRQRQHEFDIIGISRTVRWLIRERIDVRFRCRVPGRDESQSVVSVDLGIILLIAESSMYP